MHKFLPYFCSAHTSPERRHRAQARAGGGAIESQHFADFQHTQRSRDIALRFEPSDFAQRLAQRLVGEVVGAVVHRYQHAPPQVVERRHRFGGSEVRLLHDEGRLVAPDGQQAGIDIAHRLRDNAKVVAVGRITGEVERVPGRPNQEAAPQHAVEVAQPAAVSVAGAVQQRDYRRGQVWGGSGGYRDRHFPFCPG